MRELKIGETDLLAILKPDNFFGALIYLVFFIVVALLLSRALRTAVHAAMTRKGHVNLTTISFLQPRIRAAWRACLRTISKRPEA